MGQKCLMLFALTLFALQASSQQKFIADRTTGNVALSTTPGEINAIFYPSVPFGGKGVNFAFNNRFIHPENIVLLSSLRDEFQVYLNDEEIKSFKQVGSYETKGIDQANNLIHW